MIIGATEEESEDKSPTGVDWIQWDAASLGEPFEELGCREEQWKELLEEKRIIWRKFCPVLLYLIKDYDSDLIKKQIW